MIVVNHNGRCWRWTCLGIGSGGYETADHALRNAWTWMGRDVPALIYMQRP